MLLIALDRDASPRHELNEKRTAARDAPIPKREVSGVIERRHGRGQLSA
jgi:hypothetical protein